MPFSTRIVSHRSYKMLIFCIFVLIGLYGVSCKKSASETKHKPTQTTKEPVHKVPAPSFKAYWFTTPQQAFKKVLETQPTILGVGEIHQVKSQSHIPSSIRRFTHQLLGSLWGVSTDLIVETWVTTGQCGTSEVHVTQQVRKITQRPKKTENQIVTLLKQAKHIGIQPHILQVHCKTYQNLMRETGSARTRQLLLLVTRLLLQKIRAVVMQRNRNKQKANIVIYGGALHNDLYPSRSLAHLSYVPKLLKQIKKQTPERFVELDLYVPEYLHDDEDWRRKPWYPLFLKQKKTQKTLLIRRKRFSYILVLPWMPQPSPQHRLRATHKHK